MLLEKLYERLSNINTEDFYIIEAEYFISLSQIPAEKRTACVTAFLVLSNWCGTSLRSGVWTFYEICNVKEVESAICYLKENNIGEMADILAFGIHDYQNPKYAENYDYPEEWIAESEKIDLWIEKNRKFIADVERKILLENKTMLCDFFVE